MSRGLGDELLEARLRAVLEERAEEIAARSRTAAEMAAELAPRLRAADRSALRLEPLLRLGAVALLVALLVLVVATLGAGRPRSPLSLRLAVEMPLGAETGAESIVNALRLITRQAQARAGSFVLTLPEGGVFSDAVAGVPNSDRGAANMRKIAADLGYVAVIGPYNSPLAEAEIPVSNAAGILECSPSNTATALTTGELALSIRPRPDRPNYVRVASTDEDLADGAARFLFGSLGKRTVYVIYAGEPYPGDPGLAFVGAYEALGGTVVGSALRSSSNAAARINGQINALSPEAILYDGPGAEGGRLLDALSGAAAALPFVGFDPLLDGPRSAHGSFLNLAGDRAANAFGVFPATVDPTGAARFEVDYMAQYGESPTPYAVASYACAEVIIAALQRVDLGPTAGLAAWREGLRATVAERGLTYQTVLGTLGFDSHGDVWPTRVSVYGYDPAARDWKVREAFQIGAGP